LSFVHEDDDWDALLRIVSDSTDRDIGMVEKDYWVCHTLWAIHDQGFDIWFKGGTSLSKGFDLIERFSEDIDARMDAGSTGLTDPKLSWKNRRTGVRERDDWFDAVTNTLTIPGCSVERNPAGSDELVRSAWLQVVYPALYADTLPQDMRQFVLLEVGRARVVPFVERDLSSWVHDHLEANDQIADFTDNRPSAVRCIHPWVTCLEKLEAIARKFDRDNAAPDFVRHYEDSARILHARESLPELERPLDELIGALANEDRKQMPLPTHSAFNPNLEDARWQEIQQAWESIGPMFWGRRIVLADATATIRNFLADLATDPTNEGAA